MFRTSWGQSYGTARGQDGTGKKSELARPQKHTLFQTTSKHAKILGFLRMTMVISHSMGWQWFRAVFQSLEPGFACEGQAIFPRGTMKTTPRRLRRVRPGSGRALDARFQDLQGFSLFSVGRGGSRRGAETFFARAVKRGTLRRIIAERAPVVRAPETPT